MIAAALCVLWLILGVIFAVANSEYAWFAMGASIFFSGVQLVVNAVNVRGKK